LPLGRHRIERHILAIHSRQWLQALAYSQFPMPEEQRRQSPSTEAAKHLKIRTFEIGTYRLESGTTMRFKMLNLTASVLLLASVAYGKEPKHYQSGTLVRMDSVKCGTAENSGKSFAGEMLGTDSGHRKTEELLCQEYVLQTDSIIYRIRPRDAKHPVLLPVGDRAQFRMDKDKLVLRVEDLDDKDRDYTVVSMTPRDAAKPPETAAARMNHD
jgi:hypothetical protein